MAENSPEPEFAAVDRKILSKQITEQLLAMLKERQLRPGDKLPPERELAAMMQVSRPSLREALRALMMMNVLEVRQGAGTFVTSLETELLVEHLDFVVSLDDSSLPDLFEARKIVELGIVGLAAQRITEEELAELEAGLYRSGEAVNDPVAFLHTQFNQPGSKPVREVLNLLECELLVVETDAWPVWMLLRCIFKKLVDRDMRVVDVMRNLRVIVLQPTLGHDILSFNCLVAVCHDAYRERTMPPPALP